MKTISSLLSGIFSNKATSENANIHSIWAVERERAAKFGPSHVAEIDAIFSRY